MKKNKICAVIIDDNVEEIRKAAEYADLFEVRIDLIGKNWREIAGILEKPWIACCRDIDNGGKWAGNEKDKINSLLDAVRLGADIVDTETTMSGLQEIIPLIKKQARCMISYHDFNTTPDIDSLKNQVYKEIDAGADICKIVTTANKFEDNSVPLQLIRKFPEIKIVSFAMGMFGMISRVLCPLVGGDFTYASISTGKESAAGQITIHELYEIYRLMEQC